ncbi:MAG: polyprenyl glycosylphosphotransferase [Flavobacteriales bacterium]|nr:polyprenyl glycosylphosphotransferase [Flavobacteriales bacterium]|tara:strand:+ start:1232 stop:2623 length:1392 start_codon:yes stop_codon:yes gene_type:complete
MRIEKYKRIFCDVISAATSWILFFIYRKEIIEQVSFDVSETLIYGTISVTLLWMSIYTLSGNYIDVRRVSRINELYRTIIQSTIGCLIIFFGLIIDDIEHYQNYTTYYQALSVLISLHFSCTFLVRYIITTNVVRKIQNKQITFKTIIIGNTTTIPNVVQSLNSTPQSTGNKIIGYINTENREIDNIQIERIGKTNDIEKIIENHKIEEAILALGKDEYKENINLINTLIYHDIITKVTPNLVDMLAGKVKMQSFFDIPFSEIKQIKMSFFETVLKRIIDITFSLAALLALSPLLILIAIGVKLSSRGPVFYFQERLGIRSQKFNIIKFRSMYTNSEKGTPLLASKNDTRITKWGKIMRKYRLDELPQFYNVLIGEMSIIGPRPERDFFAKQILKKATHYKLIYKVKPGITSWGMVKFGYAENLDEMIERLKYDIIYLENLSLFSDFKVFILTIFIILQGRGK